MSIVSLPSSLETYSCVDCSVSAEIDKLVAVADNGFPLLFQTGLSTVPCSENDADADPLERITERILSKSSGKEMFANCPSEMHRTGRLPPCLASAEENTA